MNYGYVKVAAAVPRVKVADCKFNASEIEKEIIIADGKGVQIIAFPELCITGYTCGDLFAQQLLLEEAEMGLIQILNNTRQMDIISILGMPVALNGVLLNAAVVIQKGRVLGVVPKTYLPNYKEFYEKRWFTSACDVAENSVRLCGQIIPMGRDLLFETADTTFGVEICEDLWAPIPPSSTLALQGAEILFNLSADNEGIGKHNYLRSLISQQSARCIAGYVFSSCGFGESTTDVVFAGMVAPEQVADWYQLGDLFVSASTSETQGLTYIEALAAGVPALCRADPCLAGVIRNGENGWQYRDEAEFQARLSEFLAQPHHRERLASCARVSAEEFSAQRFAERVEAVYEEQIARRAGADVCREVSA